MTARCSVQIVRAWLVDPAGWDAAATFAVLVDGEIAFLRRLERDWSDGDARTTHGKGEVSDAPVFAHEDVEDAWWQFCERMERAP